MASSGNFSRTSAPYENKLSGTEADIDESRIVSLPRLWQWIWFVPVLFHLLAVFSEPFHFFSRSNVIPASADAAALRGFLVPYSQFMYLDHGYFFFAPNPGPGHLLKISVSNDPILESTDSLPAGDIDVYLMPDRRVQWPRLLYHRYFMLSEFYYARFAPIQLSSELSKDPLAIQFWEKDRYLYSLIQRSIADHIKTKTGKSFVALHRLERELLDRNTVLQRGERISDPKYLSVLTEGIESQLTAPPSNSPSIQLPVLSGSDSQPIQTSVPSVDKPEVLPLFPTNPGVPIKD